MSQTHPINSTLSHHTHVKIITYIVVSVSVKSILHVFCGKMTRRTPPNLLLVRRDILLYNVLWSSAACAGVFSNPYLVLKPGLKKADAVRSAFPHNTQDVV